ncbi:Pleiotropic drug resistance protein 3 [Hibiscus syriacus]|uniref:Pleiotropic drug resistance protein 3 n=1 Tax=Hibiscus syriacus TaxID=106335 RepID=A0A6A3AVC0_HIBSY|nr:Pleiotropic drug resistance protein 3 [Hibiscus syriacus]
MAKALSSSFRCGGGDEVELQWAAIERLPTSKRIRTSLFDQKLINAEEGDKLGKKVIDVARLGAFERLIFLDQLITIIDKDNLKLVGLKLPKIEVRLENLNVEAECKMVEGKPQLPTLWNTVTNMFPVNRCVSQPNKTKILEDMSSIIKPSRMTLLLGLPGCGKTTLLQTLTGKHEMSLKVSGEISYNGCELCEFVPQKTSAYINQYDLHIPDMTVRETIDFSARCQEIGSRADILKELSRREKLRGIIPEPDIDTYMKAISVEGLERTLQTDYILKILGLDICADTSVGNAMNRGISGGEMKRLRIGEMMVGPTKAFFMDGKLTGLDSSTTFQIVTCLKQLAHTRGATVLISLLQPTPETFDLFDKIILMDKGKIVYQGTRSQVHEFFEYCGFKCPPRKGLVVFMHHALSQKEQAQYWIHKDRPYSYVSTDKFIDACKEFHAGHVLKEELYKPIEKAEDHKNALLFNIYSLGKWELFKACLAREWFLTKRSLFSYVFRSAQLVLLALVTMTLFRRARMKIDEFHLRKYTACLFFGLSRVLTSGVPELALTKVTSMALPFVPVTLSFENVHSLWILPRGKVSNKKIHLLQDISGAFRPGVLTGLMGASGAGKRISGAGVLQDISGAFRPGRKIEGYMKGDIRVGGYPKVQKAYARVSGYCEQTDIHSPKITKFVEELLLMIELDEIKDSLVGIRGVSGISLEQQKQLTIAMELVANPSIIFMDEPTFGLDTRAAATVKRVVKNIVSTKRTVVCTIHQPSIDITEAFDKIILMKGGQIVDSGELGQNSCKLIEYFEGIAGVPKIKENYNPATWILEVTNPSIEAELGVDFFNLYKQSSLYQ